MAKRTAKSAILISAISSALIEYSETYPIDKAFEATDFYKVQEDLGLGNTF